jgi:hypothetical protein
MTSPKSILKTTSPFTTRASTAKKVTINSKKPLTDSQVKKSMSKAGDLV